MTTALVVLLCVHTLGTLVSRWLDRRDTARLVVRLEAIADTLCRVRPIHHTCLGTTNAAYRAENRTS